MNGSDALRAALDARAPTSITQLVAGYGGGRAGNVAAAIAIGGTSDKRSNAYQNALRNVQRHQVAEARAAGRETRAQQGRGVSARGQSFTAKMVRKATANSLRGKHITHARAPGAITWGGSGGRDYHSEGEIRTLDDFDDAAKDAMLDAYGAGDDAGAWAAFEPGLFDAYGMSPEDYSGIAFEGGEVDSLDIDWT